DVFAVLVPFVPRNFLIDEISDPQLRQQLSACLDAFCSGRDVTPPGGTGSCRIENGELICDLVPAMSLSGPLPDTAIAVNDSGEVRCSSDGSVISCRFPHAMLAKAQAATSQTSLGSLQCVSDPSFALCATALLDPNETKSAQ